MSGERWSLRRRAAWQFAAASSGFLLVVALSASLTYRLVLAAELDEEVEEQLGEFRSRYRAGAGGAEEFARLAAPNGDEQAETPTAWRAVSTAGEVFGPHGLARLVPFFAQAPARGTTLRLAHGLRVRRDELAPGLEIELVLDGSRWMERLDDFALASLGVVLGGSLASLLAGRAFAGRVAGWLERAAREVSARAGRAPGLPVEIPGAPSEIRAVAESLEHTLRATENEAERARLLLAGSAHDLRAPVQALLTSTQAALLATRDGDAVRELLEGHLSELRGLARTIDNLVAWGSPRPAVEAVTRVRFDLWDELEGRLLAEEAEAARRGVLVDVRRTGGLVMNGDPGLLVLAIRNLVGNAVTWSPAGGVVQVWLRGREGELEVSVEDEGPGVPPAERERIFSPFVRGAAAPGRRAGYGLGLAIVARTVERHGGRVHVEDARPQGARFVLRLPLEA